MSESSVLFNSPRAANSATMSSGAILSGPATVSPGSIGKFFRHASRAVCSANLRRRQGTTSFAARPVLAGTRISVLKPKNKDNWTVTR
ncbi:hypothetical protein C8R48DRAFT_701295 [Suillus tomentosus]|nr:hypothetical protein C8R48DRAFT_701295 [Suillus tomentosus]